MLLVKKSNFNISRGVSQFNISEMLQIINLDMKHEKDPFKMSYEYVNNMLMPILGLYKN